MYILLLAGKTDFIILKMARVFGRNVNVNFNYCTKTVILFMSRIIVNKLSVLSLKFRKLEKNLKCFLKCIIKSVELKVNDPLKLKLISAKLLLAMI